MAVHCLDEEVCYRIARACSAFGRLRKSVWERRGITLATKLKVYRAVVLPSLLYASETWTVYSRHARQLNSFHMRCLRNLLHVKWQDKVPDTEVLQRAQMESIYATLKRSQLRWAGHVHRMPDERLPKILLYGDLKEGKRSQGGQKKCFKDSLKATLKRCAINTETWETSAKDRSAWRTVVRAGVSNYELRRVDEQKQKRQRRKGRANNIPQLAAPPPTFACPHCTRLFRAKIGLFSHLRTHKNT